MAISEETKIAVQKYKDILYRRWANMGKQMADHQTAYDNLQAKRAELKAEYDALVADIPEPTAEL